MTDADLALPAAWTETHFERDAYGPDDRPGLAATAERDDATLSVVPVRYRREDGREEVDAVAEDLRLGRRDPTAAGDVAERTAFATRVDYRPVGSRRSDVVCVAAAADDALAVLVWLARAAPDDRALRRALAARRGASAGRNVVVADDEALDARLVGDTDHCAATGRPTRSHRFTLPYRYFHLLDGSLRSDRGVPRVPDTVDHLAGALSHGAYEDVGVGGVAFDDLDFDAPVQREAPGEYRLDPAVAALAAELDATRLVLRRLGDATE